ncbi:MAG: DsrE family protein [Nitrolancea sp.]
MASKFLVNGTCGKENAERATLAFIMGNVAAAADQETVVLLTIEGVWLATKGYAADVIKEGFPPLTEVITSFMKNGGEVWACGTCTKPRGITETDLIDGAKMVTAANVVEYLASGAMTIGF